MAKPTVLLFSDEETDGISYDEFKKLRIRYLKTLTDHPFPDPPKAGDVIKMIHYLKRKVIGIVHVIGPYTDLTVFEAANRIGTDLVMLKGIEQVMEENQEPPNSKITVRLGNRHERGRGDFTISNEKGEFEGEAFNVALSFFPGKLRSTQNKWIDENSDKLNIPVGGTPDKRSLKYILVNSDVFKEMKLKVSNVKIIPVKDWDKL